VSIQSKPAIEFAAKVVDVAINSDFNNGDVLNGMAIAAAALLVDTAMDGETLLNEDELRVIVQHFRGTLTRAVDFAVQQVLAEASAK
jgi:hypothetical protein